MSNYLNSLIVYWEERYDPLVRDFNGFSPSEVMTKVRTWKSVKEDLIN